MINGDNRNPKTLILSLFTLSLLILHPEIAKSPGNHCFDLHFNLNRKTSDCSRSRFLPLIPYSCVSRGFARFLMCQSSGLNFPRQTFENLFTYKLICSSVPISRAFPGSRRRRLGPSELVSGTNKHPPNGGLLRSAFTRVEL